MNDRTPESETTLAKWFEREFPYRPPVDLFRPIIERLRGAPVRLEERCALLPRELLTTRDGDDWSVQEHVGHLGDLEPLWSGRLDDFAASEAVLRPADLTNTVTYEADHNRSDMATLLARFRSRRESFVARVDALSNEDAARNSRHPRLDQPMRIIDHCLFIAEHDDHHMAIITSLANKNA